MSPLPAASSYPLSLASCLFLLCVGCAIGALAGFLLRPSLPSASLSFHPSVAPLFSTFSALEPSPPLPPPPGPLIPPSSPATEPKLEPDAAVPVHEMEDEELLERAAAVEREHRGTAKVAFLFLVKWDIPMAPLWEKFFAGHDGLYSIYVHTHPAFNESSPAPPPPAGKSVFFGRNIPSQEVQWGQSSMVEAERRLLASALLDAGNQRFVLLSESHVPIFNFPTVYAYLTNTSAVFTESYDDPSSTGRGRYCRRMNPLITLADWRKGSQWFELHRSAALDVVSDRLYFDAFRRHCSRKCYADEHYIPTLLTKLKPRHEVANRSLTWVDWSRGGPHPAHFARTVVTVQFLEWLRAGAGGSCTYNGEPTTVCFLFARKFLPNSLTRFMRYSHKVMGF